MEKFSDKTSSVFCVLYSEKCGFVRFPNHYILFLFTVYAAPFFGIGVVKKKKTRIEARRKMKGNAKCKVSDNNLQVHRYKSSLI